MESGPFSTLTHVGLSKNWHYLIDNAIHIRLSYSKAHSQEENGTRLQVESVAPTLSAKDAEKDGAPSAPVVAVVAALTLQPTFTDGVDNVSHERGPVPFVSWVIRCCLVGDDPTHLLEIATLDVIDDRCQGRPYLTGPPGPNHSRQSEAFTNKRRR